MQTILQMLVFIVQLAVASFVMWGGWLCFSAWLRELRGDRASRPDVAPATAAGAARSLVHHHRCPRLRAAIG
jgi:hypothetical protein